MCIRDSFTVDHKMHYLYQEGRTVFKYAVSNMSDITATIAEKNGLNKDLSLIHIYPKNLSQFGLESATRLHEAGFASNRASATAR